MTLRLVVGALAAVLLAAMVLSHPAFAQISPGPLARAHADLDRASDCLKCHVRGEPMTARCISCHGEIGASRANKRGYHGIKATGACETCHPDHAGKDFELIHWTGGSEKAFDHREAGWPLDGKHASLECARCHQPKFQQAALVARVKVKDHTRTFMALDTRCNTCHEDPHKKRFGDDCMKCHDTKDWNATRAGSFDHELTRYPLRGRHAKVECATCHDPKTAWGAKPAFAACGDCHADAHAGQARLAGKPADCAACHDERGFTPSTLPVAAHAKTAYPLEGRHRKVRCATCHAKAKGTAAAALGPAGVVMHPPHAACANCHADAHGGQLDRTPGAAACERCHGVRGFKPSRFSVADHRKVDFALDGAHAEAGCATCHGARRKNLPPPARAANAGSAGFVFALSERTCVQCHADVHGGELAKSRKNDTGCVSCHDTNHFRPSRVDVAMHDKFDFVLEGAHRAVPCVACHTGLKPHAADAALLLARRSEPPLTFARKDRTCTGCHDNPHGTQFAGRRDKGACEACHDTERFRPAVRFDHERDARFKLEGAHATVACAACHKSAPARKGATASVVYKGTPRACEACHENGTPKGRMGDAGGSGRDAGGFGVGHTAFMLMTVHGIVEGGS